MSLSWPEIKFIDFPPLTLHVVFPFPFTLSFILIFGGFPNCHVSQTHQMLHGTHPTSLNQFNIWLFLTHTAH